MLLKCILVYLSVSLASLISALPTEENKKVSSNLDLTKLYTPNPPATHHVSLTVEYTDPWTKDVMRHTMDVHLYGTIVPLAVKNFALLAKGVKAQVQGEDPKKIHILTYRKSLFTEVKLNSVIVGGKVAPQYGPFSIHGPKFKDENFILKHDRPGRLSLANAGTPDSNNSEFMISTNPDGAPEFDGKHVVFGQITAGLKELLDIIQHVETNAKSEPVHSFRIIWAIPEEYRLGDIEGINKQYQKDLTSFKSGDTSNGVTLADAMKPVKEYSVANSGKDVILSDSYANSAMTNLLFVVCIIVTGFVGYQYKDVILRKNSNIVSMR